jgi:hypothetical protein
MPECQRYLQATILTSRWLLQNAITPENAYNIKNPKQAVGGFIFSYSNPIVRTDAVCHGVNSLLSLVENAQKEELLNLPEQPLEQLLPSLRGG